MASKEFNRKKLFETMATARLDAIVASSPSNVTYTSGTYLDIPQVTFLVTTPGGNHQGLVVNEADAMYMRRDSSISDIRDYRWCNDNTEEARTAVELLAETLKDFGLARSRIGLEEDFMPVRQRAYLQKLLPDATLEDGSWALNETRIYKLPWEIETIRKAAYYTDKAIMTGFAQARVGDTERDLATAIQSYTLRFGARTFSHTVCSSGVQGTVVHAHPLDKPICLGEVVHVDFGGKFDGYATDLSRTAIVGKPTARQHFIHQTLWDAEQFMLDAMKPGARAKDLFAIGEGTLEKAGLKYPWGTLGHSNGLLVHEGFEITRTSERIIEAGMVLNVEPTHIEEGDGRYHIEDTVLVTDSGIEVLSNYYNSGEMFSIS